MTTWTPDNAAGMADGKAYNKKDYVEAMERLLDRRVIHVEKYGRPARPQRFLVAGPPPGNTIMTGIRHDPRFHRRVL